MQDSRTKSQEPRNKRQEPRARNREFIVTNNFSGEPFYLGPFASLEDAQRAIEADMAHNTRALFQYRITHYSILKSASAEEWLCENL